VKNKKVNENENKLIQNENWEIFLNELKCEKMK
jgi:hypothetical protein